MSCSRTQHGGGRSRTPDLKDTVSMDAIMYSILPSEDFFFFSGYGLINPISIIIKGTESETVKPNQNESISKT